MQAVACRYSDEYELTKAQIEEMLGPMTELERMVIALRSGLADGRIRTLEETGELLGLLREQVRRIESQALQKAMLPPPW